MLPSVLPSDSFSPGLGLKKWHVVRVQDWHCISWLPVHVHLPGLQVGKWVGGQIEKLMGQEEGSLRDFVLECLGKRTSPEALLGELEPIFGELNLTSDVNGCKDQAPGDHA